MLAYLRLFLLVSSLAVLAACAPLQTGVTGNTLTTNKTPTVSVTAEPPMTLAGHGRLWVPAGSDEMGIAPLASFDYAIYADTNSGPVPRFAYAAIVRLSDDNNWYFEPQSWKLPGSFSLNSDPGPIGLAWTTQLLSVPGAGDWATEVWKANKRQTPETWLAKRWIASMDDDLRVLMEYREPWPQCLHAYDHDTPLIGGKEGDCLRQFNARADKVFHVSGEPADLNAASVPPAGLVMPSTTPDTERLVGKVKYIDRGQGGISLD